MSSTPLIAVNQQAYAHLLASYLKSQGFEVDVVQDGSNEYVLQLDENADRAQAKAICDQFIREPDHPRYQQAAWQRSEQVDLKIPTGFSFSRISIWARSAPFTALILAVCTVVFVLSVLGLFAPIAHAILMQSPSQLWESQQWWRLIGPAFVHFSILHFAFNLLWWSMLGAQIEQKLGLTMLVLIFLVSAVLSNLAQAIVSGPNFGGLSGVVYALLGFVWWAGWLKPSWGFALPKAIVGFMLVWLVLGYADILWVSMANTAHTVGLVSGCVMAWLLSVGYDKRNA